MTCTIRTCLWFQDGRGPEAAAFYCSLIPGSRVLRTFGADAGMGQFSVTDFLLGGVPYQILDAGPMFPQSECVSISVETDTQAESDRLWDALTADGGTESACGWCKDRWGVSWQITPRTLIEAMAAGGAEAGRAFAAMMEMTKIDVAAIDKARRG